MRTTVTLDDDVAAALEELRRETGRTFRSVVNESIRAGIAARNERPVPTTRPYETVDVGRLLVPSLDNIGEVLDLVEGPWHR